MPLCGAATDYYPIVHLPGCLYATAQSDPDNPIQAVAYTFSDYIARVRLGRLELLSPDQAFLSERLTLSKAKFRADRAAHKRHPHCGLSRWLRACSWDYRFAPPHCIPRLTSAFFLRHQGPGALMKKGKRMTTTAIKTNTRRRADKPHTDIYQQITNHIIEAIEAGVGDWRMPWHTDGTSSMRPVNAISGKPYRGVNVLALWCAAQEQGYSSDKWATYKQWQESGAQVRKGEKSSLIVFWKINDATNGEGSDGAEAEGEQPDEPNSRRIFARGYCVFNAEQIEGYTAPPVAAPIISEIERIEGAEQFFAGLGAEIRHGGNRAFYRPGTDHIQMPHFESFRDAVAYYATLAHEVTHWTGAKTRLDRDLSGRFGNEAYAGEELVAELGAAFLAADLSLANEPRPDHAAYVASWLKVLRSDTRAIFTAAAKAQQAIDYAHGLQPVPINDPEAEPAAYRGPAGAGGQFTLNL